MLLLVKIFEEKKSCKFKLQIKCIKIKIALYPDRPTFARNVDDGLNWTELRPEITITEM